MQTTHSHLPAWLRNGLTYLAWTLIFAVAYAQSPLYTSNQNQYFLHGLADAGLGYLQADWLANTLDPTPVFSLLVNLSYRLAQLREVFYFEYALLMGVYFYSLLAIISHSGVVQLNGRARTALSALLVLVHSAAWRFTLSRTLGVNWTYLLEDGVADQRMLGPVLQPSAFGVLLLVSLWLYLRGRPYAAVLAGALAATLHPTYLLGAGLLTAAYLVDTYLEERRLSRPLRIGVVALAGVAPILAYTLSAFGGGAEQAARARQILVNFRIPHHALIQQWFDLTVVVKLVLITSALFLARGRRLGRVLAVVFVMAVTLTAIQALSGSNTLALLFPWRISTLLVPLSSGLLAAWAIAGVVRFAGRGRAAIGRAISWASWGLIAACVLVGAVRFTLDLQRKATAAERPVQQYIYAQSTPGQVFLTPLKMQDFRLEAGTPAFVDFKSIPYRSADVLEWYRRVQLADQLYLAPDCDALHGAFSAEGLSHIIVPSGDKFPCTFLVEIYRDPAYRVLELR